MSEHPDAGECLLCAAPEPMSGVCAECFAEGCLDDLMEVGVL
ncbi:MAG: hypothetical protein OXG44_10650 [Gammaproteobacteria bacterium]|nr:hypothetical protein [Gammaproteobacteria bacterium]